MVVRCRSAELLYNGRGQPKGGSTLSILNMKKAILLAATLGFSPAAFSPALAEPSQLFNILTPAAGNITFSGEGTATFNQSLGTNNNFNVGSSSNFGVNASASSTQDYAATGSALLDLAGSSRIQQTIGTASSAFNTSVVTEAAATAANSIAAEAANSSSWGVSAEAKYGAEADWNNNKASYEAQWKAGWEAEYKTAYSSAYSNVVSNSQVTSSNTDGSNSQTGTISAAFTTTEVGTGTQSLQKAIAEQSANSEWGVSAEAKYGASYTNADATQKAFYDAEWKAGWESSYEQSYESAGVQAAASAARFSNSNVVVTGIGVIADINSKDTSSFNAEASKPAPSTDGNGNANASAGGNLSTSSFATQANSTTASAFMQAFSAPKD